MKFTSLILTSLLAGVQGRGNVGPQGGGGGGGGGGGALATCSRQAECVKFTIEEQIAPVCDGYGCTFVVCMTILNDGTCKGEVSNSCRKNLECKTESDNGFASATPIFGTDAAVQCQFVAPGAKAEFYLKDGQEDCGTWEGAMPVQYDIETRYHATCQNFLAQYPATESCHTNNDGALTKQAPCLWTIPVPNDCTIPGVVTGKPLPEVLKVAGIRGDPHVKRWDRKEFEFHGECDLVIAKATVEGKKFELHARTSISEWWSSVTGSAMKFGSSSFEVGLTELYANKAPITDAQLPMTLNDFTIPAPVYGTGDEEGVKYYNISISERSHVVFHILHPEEFLNVFIIGSEDDFGQEDGAIGLAGEFNQGKAWDRGMVNRFDDLQQFALHWQVNPTKGDSQIFVNLRHPQYPTACLLPSTVKPARRLGKDSGLYKAAKEACANKENPEGCMTDVMNTGKIGLAKAW